MERHSEYVVSRSSQIAMRYIPYVLVALHALLAILAFGVAALNPNTEHMALLLLLLVADLPWSLAFEFGSAAIAGSPDSSLRLWINFALYLSLGTLWYYWIGRGVVWVLRKFSK